MEHSKECLERTEKAKALAVEWETRWPEYCRNCGGRGMFVYYFDPSPAGVSLSPGLMEDAEPCDQCTENGYCARCGEDSLGEEGEGPCSACGWNYDDGLPEMPECFCWMEEVDEAVEMMDRYNACMGRSRQWAASTETGSE